MRQEDDLLLASVVPDLHADDLQNLMLPPYMFSPADVDMYDVIVAVDEATRNGIRLRLMEAGRPTDRDHVCVLDDFFDAYDELLASEEAEGFVPDDAVGLSPGFLSAGTLKDLAPGMPLKGCPRRLPVGRPLEGLPATWAQCLWALAAASDLSDPAREEQSRADLEAASQRTAGFLLRAAVGIERTLRGSVPPGMRWWNDEEVVA